MPTEQFPTQTTPTQESSKPETQEYTIKSVNTGLLGEHVRETVTVDGDEYSAGEKVSLTEDQVKSLKDAGVKFE